MTNQMYNTLVAHATGKRTKLIVQSFRVRHFLILHSPYSTTFLMCRKVLIFSSPVRNKTTRRNISREILLKLLPLDFVFPVLHAMTGYDFFFFIYFMQRYHHRSSSLLSWLRYNSINANKRARKALQIFYVARDLIKFKNLNFPSFGR